MYNYFNMLDEPCKSGQRASSDFTAAVTVEPWPYVDGVFSTEYPLLKAEQERLLCVIAAGSNARSLNDIGSGNGWLLPIAKRYFDEVRAFDDDPAAIPAIKKSTGVEVARHRLSADSIAAVADADVLVFNHVFYYLPRDTWEPVIQAATAERKRRKTLLFSLWSRNCLSYQLGTTAAGCDLPCAEDLFEPIVATGGKISVTSAVEGTHFVPADKVTTLSCFLSLDIHQEQAQSGRPRGHCLDFAPPTNRAWIPTHDATVVGQRDLTIVAEFE